MASTSTESGLKKDPGIVTLAKDQVRKVGIPGIFHSALICGHQPFKSV